MVGQKEDRAWVGGVFGDSDPGSKTQSRDHGGRIAL